MYIEFILLYRYQGSLWPYFVRTNDECLDKIFWIWATKQKHCRVIGVSTPIRLLTSNGYKCIGYVKRYDEIKMNSRTIK